MSADHDYAFIDAHVSASGTQWGVDCASGAHRAQQCAACLIQNGKRNRHRQVLLRIVVSGCHRQAAVAVHHMDRDGFDDAAFEFRMANAERKCSAVAYVTPAGQREFLTK